MNRKWINEKDFVTDIVFRYTITITIGYASLCYSCQRKTSAGSLFYHILQSCKCQQMKIKWRYFVPKIINIGLDLLELFEQITGVRIFLRHSVCIVTSWQMIAEMLLILYNSLQDITRYMFAYLCF